MYNSSCYFVPVLFPCQLSVPFPYLLSFCFCFEAEKREKGSRSPLQDEAVDEDDYMSEDMRHVDRQAMERIRTIIHDFEPDLNNASQGSKDRSRKFLL